MPRRPGQVIVVDRGMDAAMRRQKAMRGHSATVGIQGQPARKSRGGIDNVGLGVVHEFGANIAHPGGTPFTVASVGGSSRSGGFVGSGQVTFLPKGSTEAIGVTRPHMIRIPERSFLRSTFDRHRNKYINTLENQAGRVIDGTATPAQAIGTVGELHLADVRNAINAGISPPNAPSTVARKGGSTPLIASGTFKNSITVKVSKRR